MEEAKNLLWNGHTVNDIATQLGYRNVSHFILIFKKTFGETPRQMTPKSKTHKEPPLTI
jgi:AraC-like DNA-binding protein